MLKDKLEIYMKHILLTDIHFGAKGNSDEFNEQCIEFLKWVKKESDKLSELYNFEMGCTIFLGDWFHNRNSINVKTLNYGIKGLEILGDIGSKNIKFLLGNHDLYYKDRRDVFSIPPIKGELNHIHIIDEPYYRDGFLYCPWLIGEEKLSDLIKQYNPQYVFGHFEIPSFSFNRLSKYDGEYNPSDYQGPILVPLWNRSSSPFVIEVGMRIAQMVFLPVIHAKFKVCQEFSQTEERGDKGFGSTGV